MSRQLPLSVQLRDDSSFENFYAPRDAEVVDTLYDLVAGEEPGRVVYLWGAPGSGRTHLLEAVCRLAHQRGQAAYFVPLADHAAFGPELLEGMEGGRVVCLDDVQAIAGAREWEMALFTLCDRVLDRGGALVAAGGAAPANLGLVMPELSSRLARDLVYRLRGLADDEKLVALRRRAARRGIDLPIAVAEYLLTRYPRDMQALFMLLERIDRAALARQRRVTIPFVRELEQADDTGGAPQRSPARR